MLKFIAPLLAVLVLIVLPLWMIARRAKAGKSVKKPLYANICGFFLVMFATAVVFLGQGVAAANDAAEVAAAAGLNRMNIHVIRWATQAFATVVKAEGEEACKKGVVICYDCRLNSEKFAREAAGVMAANGIRVRIFDALRPTPRRGRRRSAACRKGLAALPRRCTAARPGRKG